MSVLLAGAGAAAKYLAPILLPIILGKVAGSYDNAQIAKGVASGNVADINGRLMMDTGKGTAIKPFTYPGRRLATGTAKFGQGVAGLSLAAAPYLISMIGRGIQGAGVTAGAAAQAAGNIPAHIVNALHTPEQRSFYGGGILDAVGGIASDLGGATGTGLSMAGNVVGGMPQEIANNIQLARMQHIMEANWIRRMQMAKEYGNGLSGHAWDAIGRETSAESFGNKRR